jgi:hypothetical protein
VLFFTNTAIPYYLTLCAIPFLAFLLAIIIPKIEREKTVIAFSAAILMALFSLLIMAPILIANANHLFFLFGLLGIFFAYGTVRWGEKRYASKKSTEM